MHNCWNIAVFSNPLVGCHEPRSSSLGKLSPFVVPPSPLHGCHLVPGSTKIHVGSVARYTAATVPWRQRIATSTEFSTAHAAIGRVSVLRCVVGAIELAHIFVVVGIVQSVIDQSHVNIVINTGFYMCVDYRINEYRFPRLQ